LRGRVGDPEDGEDVEEWETGERGRSVDVGNREIGKREIVRVGLPPPTGMSGGRVKDSEDVEDW
jgi:hypothetical protein